MYWSLNLATLLIFSKCYASTSFPSERWGRAKKKDTPLTTRRLDLEQGGQAIQKEMLASSSAHYPDNYTKLPKEKTYREEKKVIREMETKLFVEHKKVSDWCILNDLPSPVVSPRRQQEEDNLIKELQEDLEQRRKAKIEETEQQYPLKVEYKVGEPKLFFFQKYREEPLEADDFGKPEKKWDDYFSSDEFQKIVDNYKWQVEGTSYPCDVFDLMRLGNRSLARALLSEDEKYHYLAVNHLIKSQMMEAKRKANKEAKKVSM